MTTPTPGPPHSARRYLRPVVTLAVLLLVLWALAAARASLPDWLGGSRTPRITHDVVVEQMRDVARLVSTEMTLRDVVIFQNTRYGSTKRGLYVVTGKVLAGIDLQQGTAVNIDHARRRIAIRLPPARILAVDILDMRTYDERSGLINIFTTEDRDAIQGQIRAQLLRTASESGILAKADTSARGMLRALLSRDGYTVDVGLPPVRLDTRTPR